MIETKILAAPAAALELIRQMIKADRDNVYRNTTDVTFTLKLITPDYSDELCIFAPYKPRGITAVMLRAYGAPDEENGKVICDGSTLSPDWPKGVLPASGIHDPLYASIKRVADEWKDKPYMPGPNFQRDRITRLTVRRDYPTWTEADVRQLFDNIFGDAIRDGGGGWLASRAYYSGVRLAGGIWRSLKRALAVVALMAFCGTLLAGCMTPPDIADFDNLPDMVPVAR